MAKEKFEDRVLIGEIKVACKYDDGTIRYWHDIKQNIVARIIQIVKDYSRQGYVLTLRQLHYQLVTRDPRYVNHDSAYKKLGTILDDCRYAGIIDWDAIEDRGRQPYIPYSADNLADGLNDLKNQYRIDRQAGQKTYVELWTEKDALSGILRRSTSKYHIQLVVNKGYTSSSAIYGAYQRIQKQIMEGKQVRILYFGDHDPSGLDMVRDIRERLLFFMSASQGAQSIRNSDAMVEKVNEWWMRDEQSRALLVEKGYIHPRVLKYNKDAAKPNPKLVRELQIGIMSCFLEETGLFKVMPIGLTMEQIKEYDLPANPAKLTDTRAEKYVAQFGEISWEVDALEPTVLTEIVDTHIQEVLDISLYNEVVSKEQTDIDRIEELIAAENERNAETED